MFCDLFEEEQNDLLMDLLDIPKKACDRRVCSPFSTQIFVVFCLSWHAYLYVILIFVHVSNDHLCVSIMHALYICIYLIPGQL
jgi:hypothetical protein